MTEIKARHIALIVIAAEVILATLYWGLSILDELEYNDYYDFYGEELFPGFVVFCILTMIGIVIILSAFYKIPFYILRLLEITLAIIFFIAMVINLDFEPIILLICLAILAPQIFYYFALLYIH